MNRKAFTLIELLVVVAIIGILAAVGVNTFSGFQEKAKISVSKSNHNKAVKFIQIKITECNFSGEILLKSKVNNLTNNTISCSPSTGSGDFAEYISNHLNNQGFKNPYNNNQGAFAVHTNDIGQTWFGAAGNSGVTFYTLITKIDDNASNNITTTFDDPRK